MRSTVHQGIDSEAASGVVQGDVIMFGGVFTNHELAILHSVDAQKSNFRASDHHYLSDNRRQRSTFYVRNMIIS
ncbi:hypothetical protein E4T56_gene315 [Termitomyces sp. T112]|nr:hypothetical protein E4T56_gene315 [Termitomyces sp. T112]